MKELAELKDLMAELLDGEIQFEPEMAVTERGKEIINEIADYAETTELFRKEHHRGDMLQGKTFREMFLYMLDRVCNAPTIFHVCQRHPPHAVCPGCHDEIPAGGEKLNRNVTCSRFDGHGLWIFARHRAGYQQKRRHGTLDLPV